MSTSLHILKINSDVSLYLAQIKKIIITVFRRLRLFSEQCCVSGSRPTWIRIHSASIFLKFITPNLYMYGKAAINMYLFIYLLFALLDPDWYSFIAFYDLLPTLSKFFMQKFNFL
jgi:hypothetical protein